MKNSSHYYSRFQVICIQMNKVADPSVLKRRRAPSINTRHSPGYEDLPSGMCCGVLDTTPEEDDEPMYRIAIPGYRAIFGAKTPNYRRIGWILLALIFLCLAINQVQDRIKYYLKTPINVNLVVTSNDTLVFPRLTLCTREPFNYTAMEALRPQAAKKLGIQNQDVQMPYDLVTVMPLDVLWKKIAHQLDVLTIECWFGRNKSCADSGSWTLIYTMLGPCYYYEVDFPVTETGLFNGMYLKMNGAYLTKPKVPGGQVPSLLGFSLQTDGSSTQTNSSDASSSDTNGWTFFLHDKKTNPSLAIYANGDSMNPTSSVDVSISSQQFTCLNTWHSECNSDEIYTVTNCELQCLSDLIVQSAACRLPSMPNTTKDGKNVPLCNTSTSYRNAELQLQLMLKANYWNVADCKCARGCKSTSYTTSMEKVYADIKANQLRFRAYYNDKTYEDISETLAYQIIALFCDIGNSISLLLGASVLTLYQAFEYTSIHLVSFIHKHTVAKIVGKPPLK